MRLFTLLLFATCVLLACDGPATPVPTLPEQTTGDALVRETIEKKISEVRDRPGRAESWLILGHLYFAHGYERQAIEAYAEAARLKPKLALAHALRGVALNRVGAQEDANLAMIEAQQADPSLPQHYWVPGLWALQAGDLDRARELANAALQVAPKDVEAGRLMAQVELQEGDAAAAVGRLTALIPLRRTDRGLRSELSVAHRAAGELELAAQQRAIAGDVDPDWPNPSVKIMGRHRTDLKIWVQRLLAAANRDRVMDARRELENLRSYYDGEPLFELVEAVILQKEGNVTEALAILDRVVDEDPNWIDARMARGSMHLEMSTPRDLSRLPLAETDFRRVLELEPRQIRAHQKMAKVSSLRGDAAGATQALQSALEIEPHIRQHANALADVQLKSGRAEEAIATLDIAVARFGPEGPLPLVIRTRASLALDRVDDARRSLAMLKAVAPRHPALTQLGRDVGKAAP